MFRSSTKFTFQYGQIYYFLTYHKSIYLPQIYIPIWLDLLFIIAPTFQGGATDLHSNMVRFIIIYDFPFPILNHLFTFQYGQIYYPFDFFRMESDIVIYIPIWLDLLFPMIYSFNFILQYLHSNMVRFIIHWLFAYMTQNWNIYIPIWLDLLSINTKRRHSSAERFTFQYGQIYYCPLLL